MCAEPSEPGGPLFGAFHHRSLMKAATRLWWQAFVSVAYCSGLRCGEIVNLTWGDIDFEHQMICIVSKKESESILEWEPKDHENKAVPMGDETTQLLANLEAEAKEGSPYAFVSPERLRRILQRRAARKWSPSSNVINNLARDFGVICGRAGVAKCTLHDLRRSAITNWAQKLPIQVVQQLAGHSDISTTRKYYLAVRSEDILSATELVNRILAGVSDD